MVSSFMDLFATKFWRQLDEKREISNIYLGAVAEWCKKNEGQIILQIYWNTLS